MGAARLLVSRDPQPGGAALMLIIVLYPYVYLLARASFRQQSSNAFLVARTLGQSPMKAFWRVALPMARPAIAGARFWR